MKICTKCRLLQADAPKCRFCDSSLDLTLPLRRETATSKRTWQLSKSPTTMLRISGVAIAAVLGALFGFLPKPIFVLSLSFAALMAMLLGGLLPRARWVGLWALFALLSKLLTVNGLVVALVSLGLLILPLLAMLLWGVPTLSRMKEGSRALLAGTTPPWLAARGEALHGRVLEGRGRTIQHTWSLFERDGKLLVRGADATSWTLDLGQEQIPLEGALAVVPSGRLRDIDVEEAHTRLGIPRSIPLPARLRLAERHLRAGDEARVSGTVVSESRATGYREVTFSRRLVGSADRPLVLR